MSDERGPRNELLEARRLEYGYLREENKRLRDGRAELTRQLGPLPIGAAVVAALVAGLPETRRGGLVIHHPWLLWVALGLGVLMMIVSLAYSGLKPYRELRAKQAQLDRLRSSADTEPAWYDAAIELERAIYGEKPALDKWWKRLGRWLGRTWPKHNIGDLQEGYDRERIGLYLVQALFAAVVIFLVAARVT